MGWRLAADTVLMVHMGFLVFIVAGGLLVRRCRWVAGIQLAAVAYGGLIQLIGFTCPLTPFEKDLRHAAGDAGYDGGFIDHYVTSVLYPGELTPAVKVAMVALVAVANVAVYTWALRSRLMAVAVR